MELKLIEDRIQHYQPKNKHEEFNALKEITQEIALCALSRANFFKQGAFQGGTCLRILYGLNRFSEDLDFVLYQPNMNFEWQGFKREIVSEFVAWGLEVEVKTRKESSNTIKKAFLKNNSFGALLHLIYERSPSDIQTINIKLEIDTNPPEGSTFENKIVEFPSPFSISSQSIPSLFSGKIHALLSRSYLKGRDWYDFIWYVTRKSTINMEFLQNALSQQGPWKNQSLRINKHWVIQNLGDKIRDIDWQRARKDVENFIKPHERESLTLWNEEFFLHFVNKMNEYL